MKALAPALLLAAALLAPSAAQADSWRGEHRGYRPPAHRYYRNHRPSDGYYRHSHRYQRPYYRPYRPYRYYSTPYRYYSAPYYGYGYEPNYYGAYGAYGYYPPPAPPYCARRPRPRIGFWFGF